jgi:polysaccharide deacetylase 2 family uncharacterized protein YibQ
MINTEEVYRAEITIPGIPASVPFTKLIEAIDSLGFNVNLVNSMEILPDSVRVKITAYKPDGRTMTDNNQRVEHTIVIPIEDDTTAA